MQNTILSCLPNAFQHDMESVEILGESSWKAVIHTECDSSEMCENWIVNLPQVVFAHGVSDRVIPILSAVSHSGIIMSVSTVRLIKNTQSVIIRKLQDVVRSCPSRYISTILVIFLSFQSTITNSNFFLFV